jgi:phosphoglycerol transferase MdoB-like AlkP superfamily enzyme
MRRFTISSRNYWMVFYVSWMLSLFFFRLEIIQSQGLSFQQIQDTKFFVSWIFDTSLVFLFLALSHLLRAVFQFPLKVFLLPFIALAWFVNLANVFYFSFFGSQLEWWTARYHWADLFVVHDVALSYSVSPWISLSLFCLLVIFFLSFFVKTKPQKKSKAPASSLKLRLKSVGSGVVLVVCALLVKQSTVWFKAVEFDWFNEIFRGNFLNEQIVFTWWDQGTQAQKSREISRQMQSRKDDHHPTAVLAAYRDGVTSWQEFNEWLKGQLSGNGAEQRTLQSNFLRQNLSFTEDETRELRKKLALPTEGPVHIFLILLESVRAFEVYHPEWGQELMPHLHRRMNAQGLRFQQFYNSGTEAGQTVRGQFSSLCSMLPNMTGAPVYLSQTNISTVCLQQLLSDAGYLPVAIYAASKDFHNKRAFESFHGTRLFYDKQDFRKLGPMEEKTNWGIDDKDFFNHAWTFLEKQNHEGGMFNYMVNVGTHYPFAFRKEHRLPVGFFEKWSAKGMHRNYLSLLNHLDASLEKMIQEVFASPLGERSVFVVTADHSTPSARPQSNLTDLQWEEAQVRIPLVFLTRDQENPQIFHQPAHQVDLAPTLARVAGLEGEMTWVGGDLFKNKEGRAWVLPRSSEVSYRTSKTACYYFAMRGERECVDVSENQDPLFDLNLRKVDENPDQNVFFQKLVEENRNTLFWNLLK